MSDFVTSVIRTWVPILVGAAASWLTTKGVELTPEATAGLATFLTALFGGVYYVVVRLLERQWPQVGVLLGSTKKPEYRDPEY